MIDHSTFARGMDCLERAEHLLTRGGAGEPPTAASLEQLRAWLFEARAELDAAKRFLRAE